MINRDNPIPLYIQLKEHIKELIFSKQYLDNDQIPTENEWMQQFNLGRATVRSALLELEREGIIYKRRGIGTFVSPKKSSSAFIPLISLTYPLKAMGLEPENCIIENKTISPNSNLLKEMHCKISKKKRYVKRIRSVNNYNIAIESSYFSMKIFEKLKDYDMESSIASLLVEQGDLNIQKIDQTIITRTPTKQEVKILNLTENQNVLELIRWIYEKESTEPFSYVKFVMVDSLPNVVVKYKA